MMVINALFRVTDEGRRLSILSLLAYCVLCSLMIVSVLGLSGCQVDLNGSVGSKLLYPDNIGDKKIGDPRGPMYEGSGYSEHSRSGGDVGFRGLRGES